jgi:hypothetical protein
MDVATLTGLLREAEQHHARYEPTAPAHHWSGFYAAYIIAREEGRTPEQADAEARQHLTAVPAVTSEQASSEAARPVLRGT